MDGTGFGTRPAGRQPWLIGSRTRQARLASGLILFTYVTLHLLNHAVLNVSIAAADAVLLWQKWLWQGYAGSVALYGALTVHAGLGLWALYARRHAGWRAGDMWQMALGLSVPPLLANHVTVTRLAWGVFGLDKGYAAELNALWVAGPRWGWVQLAVLVVAWAHACLGLSFLLRLRRWWPAAKPWLAAGAVLLPVLAVLGFAAGGRAVAALLHDPAWKAAHLPLRVTGTPAQAAWLARARDLFWGAYAAAIGLLLLARGARALRDMRGRRVAVRYPGGRVVRVPLGMSVLDASRRDRIRHASACGGKGRCSTCRVRIMASAGALPAPSAHEARVLARIGAAPDRVRLACQLRPAADLAVAPLIPPEIATEFILGRAPRMPDEERMVAVMFIDLRGSMALAEHHMPFDAVFLLGRFMTAATKAVVESGGRPVQFLGDGLLALFGLDTQPGEACRQALTGVAAAAAGLADLAHLFGQETGGALRYGIGLHWGSAIVGEIGFGPHVAFTVLGDTVHVAHRLQELAREAGVAAVISEEVFRVAGESGAAFTQIEAGLRGRSAALAVRLVPGAWSGRALDEMAPI